MINVGIDVGKRFCQAALKADDERLLDELRFVKARTEMYSMLDSMMHASNPTMNE